MVFKLRTTENEGLNLHTNDFYEMSFLSKYHEQNIASDVSLTSNLEIFFHAKHLRVVDVSFSVAQSTCISTDHPRYVTQRNIKDQFQSEIRTTSKPDF